jgi:hypothetical protein
MKVKTLQIMLVLAAVLCVVGIFAGLGAGTRIDAENFRPPVWLKSLGGLAGGPQLSVPDLTANGVSWRQPLMLPGGATRHFKVVKADDEVRRAAFLIGRQGRDMVNIRYQPKPGQRLNGESVDSQRWPNGEDGEPNFVVYDGGGTFVFQNTGPTAVEIRLED